MAAAWTPRLNIRWRLTAWNAVVMTAVMTIFSVMLLIAVRQHLTERADQTLQEELRELIEEINFYPDTTNLGQQLERRYSVHAHYHFRVLDQNGVPLFRSRFLTNVELPTVADPGKLRGSVFQDIELPELGTHRLLTMAMRDSRSNPLLLQVLAPRMALDSEFRSYVWMILTAGPLALCTAILAGYFLAGRSLAPIEDIAATAERISARNLSERVSVADPDDELGRLAILLNEAFDRLQTSINDVRQFTADAAHELRSPLAIMRTEAEVALRSARSDEEYRRVIQVTLDEATRLGELSDQLLTLSRHDSGALGPFDDIVAMDALLTDVLEKFQLMAQEKGVRFESTPLPEWYVQGDDIWLSRLFFNLLDNALKYTEKGGTVRLSATVVDDTEGRTQVRYVVEDTGIGIAPEHLPSLFKRFYRADESRNRRLGGTGLGLAICQSIVNAHKGSIQVESTKGIGSRFTVTLPGSAEDRA